MSIPVQMCTDLIIRSFFQNDPTKIGPGAPNPSEGVLANFFNSLLSKKTGQTGFQPGQGGAQIKPPNATDDCKFDFLFLPNNMLRWLAGEILPLKCMDFLFKSSR